ncbi:MAG: gas vesicle protein GvpG [Pseudomonadota bacterium]
MLGLVTKALALPASGPTQGVWWVLNKLTDAAEAEFYSPDAIKATLVALEAKLEADEMTEDEYEEQELVLLQRLKEGRAQGR